MLKLYTNNFLFFYLNLSFFLVFCSSQRRKEEGRGVYAVVRIFYIVFFLSTLYHFIVNIQYFTVNCISFALIMCYSIILVVVLLMYISVNFFLIHYRSKFFIRFATRRLHFVVSVIFVYVHIILTKEK